MPAVGTELALGGRWASRFWRGQLAARLCALEEHKQEMPTSFRGRYGQVRGWAHLATKCLEHPDKVRGAAGVETGHDIPVIRRLVGGWQGVDGRADMEEIGRPWDLQPWEEAAWRPSGAGVEPAAMV